MSATIEDIRAAADALRREEVVAFPTETVYGLGADAFSQGAVERVFALKGRPSFNPLIVHVSGPDMAQRVAREWPDAARVLAAAFWPGPLSIVLPKRAELPDIVTGGPGSHTVAVRCPDHPIALALLYEFGEPLVGPSANFSGGISPTTAEHVRSSFAESDVTILDGGPCATGIESTVISLAGPSPRVLRQGVVSAEDLAAVLCGPVETFTQVHTNPGGALPSPGMLLRHYAPRTPTKLIDAASLASQVASVRPGEHAAILAFDAAAVQLPHLVIQMPRDAAEYAARLYAALREADDAGATVILVERPRSNEGIWAAIWDRLSRATAD